MAGSADANIGFTLTPDGRARLLGILDRLVGDQPQASAVLTDLAGRIVEIARKPLGVKLDEIAALAAGTHASSQQLAVAMEEGEFALVFLHDDDRQVAVWPLAGRALLVAILRGTASTGEFEHRMDGALGRELVAVLEAAREPLKSVPPPRVTAAEIPAPVAAQMRMLTERIMTLQAGFPAGFPPEIQARLVKSRDDLGRTIGALDWPGATKLLAETGRWLMTVTPPG